MALRDSTGWMWAEACQFLEQAERMQRQFFRLGASAGESRGWEPPIDVFEDEEQITILVALPGVPPERVEVTMEPRCLVIRAERRLPMEEHDCSMSGIEV